jgi:hypothetical protein
MAESPANDTALDMELVAGDRRKLFAHGLRQAIAQSFLRKPLRGAVSS